MRILALETSGLSGAVTVASAERVLHTELIPAGQRTAAGLAPAMQRALAAVGWAPSEVQLVAVTIGPGSFTGLRVGVATAKAFAYGVGCAVLGIDTLRVLAAQAPANVDRVEAVLDAYRRQLFAASFERDGANGWRCTQPTRVVDEAEWLATRDSATPLIGPVLARLSAKLASNAVLIERERWEPTSTAVAELAWRDWQAGERSDVWQLAPQYYRPSAAEEQRDRVDSTRSGQVL